MVLKGSHGCVVNTRHGQRKNRQNWALLSNTQWQNNMQIIWNTWIFYSNTDIRKKNFKLWEWSGAEAGSWRARGVSMLGDIQNPTGKSPEQPVLVNLFWAVGRSRWAHETPSHLSCSVTKLLDGKREYSQRKSNQILSITEVQIFFFSLFLVNIQGIGFLFGFFFFWGGGGWRGEGERHVLSSCHIF